MSRAQTHMQPSLAKNGLYFQRGLNNIPSEFDQLTNLREIDLSYNKLSRVPEPIYRLENLRRANFSHNEISEMSSLTGYLISHWCFVHLHLVSEKINVSNHMTFSECWTEMVTLNLTENKLKEIPVSLRISELGC